MIPAIIVVCIYYQDLSFSPTNWDDEKNIFNNPCLQKFSVENIATILTPGKIPEEQLYIPFTYMSYLVESGTFGLKSSVLHLDNILIHLLNIYLVFSFAQFLFRNRYAALAACTLFAVHPLQVEAVAWCMGRKDLLMTSFSLLCLINFTCFVTTSSKKAYMVSLAFFFAAVFSKPSAFVLPLMLPALFWYFDRKIDRESLFRLVPFFVISAIACLINSKLEMNTFGHELKFVLFRVAFIPAVAEDWLSRILLLKDAGAYYSWYDYYDGSRITLGGVVILLSFVAAGAYAYLRKVKIVFFGIFFLLVSFIPAAILISWSFRDFVTADRYGYFPLIGIFLICGAAVSLSDSRTYRAVFACAFSLFIMLSAWGAYRQASVWKNSETLWKSVASGNQYSFIGHYNLGNYYFKSKYDLKSAEFHYRRANSITPDSDAWFNMGIICELTDRKDESYICYSRAVALNPDSAYAVRKLALACYRKGDLENALKHFLRLTELSPSSPDAYLYCGKIFEVKGEKGMAAKAFGYFEKLKREGN
ncbi:MAG: hypothetical protein A2X45_07975 [Lentisphaerae bacterium GWF2_50_93]|nr:MAG: hypothetical protein A2X45_07975 [Lentisphaerae bacterium GWF2_50_93]